MGLEGEIRRYIRFVAGRKVKSLDLEELVGYPHILFGGYKRKTSRGELIGIVAWAGEKVSTGVLVSPSLVSGELEVGGLGKVYFVPVLIDGARVVEEGDKIYIVEGENRVVLLAYPVKKGGKTLLKVVIAEEREKEEKIFERMIPLKQSKK